MSSLLVSWNTLDKVVSTLATLQASTYIMSIPSSAFIDNSIYPLTLNLTNYDLTFMRLQTLKFVPVSCHFFTVSGNDSFSAYRLYKQPQAV